MKPQTAPAPWTPSQTVNVAAVMVDTTLPFSSPPLDLFRGPALEVVGVELELAGVVLFPVGGHALSCGTQVCICDRLH